MNEIEPILKLIVKREFDFVRRKYIFKDKEAKEIEKAKPLDVLALTVVSDSVLRILDVKILNEENQKEFIELLKTGAVKQEKVKDNE